MAFSKPGRFFLLLIKSFSTIYRFRSICECLVSLPSSSLLAVSDLQSTGTEAGRNNFPGVGRPFGMVKFQSYAQARNRRCTKI
jgi:hypothetical protein